MRGVNSWNAVSSDAPPISARGPYLDVLREQPVEQVHVCGFEVGKVLELLNWGGLHGQEPQACCGGQYIPVTSLEKQLQNSHRWACVSKLSTAGGCRPYVPRCLRTSGEFDVQKSPLLRHELVAAAALWAAR